MEATPRTLPVPKDSTNSLLKIALVICVVTILVLASIIVFMTGNYVPKDSTSTNTGVSYTVNNTNQQASVVQTQPNTTAFTGTSEQAYEKFGYKAEVVSTKDQGVKVNGKTKIFSLMFTDNSGSREIYSWQGLVGLGFGSYGCSNNVTYSADGKYFIVCAGSAVGVEHNAIPLMYDNKGTLVKDFAALSNFPTSTGTDSSGTKFTATKKGYSLGWDGYDVLVLLKAEGTNGTDIYAQLWRLSTGAQDLTKVGQWQSPNGTTIFNLFIVDKNSYKIEINDGTNSDKSINLSLIDFK